jgi:hypothetical protein
MRALLLAAALAAILPASAARILPAQPIAFERVVLRMTVDGCAFSPSTVHVRAVGGTLQLTQQPNACLVPGPIVNVDVRLGSLAAGQYRVEIYASADASGVPVETLAFEVSEPARIAIFPPPPRPLADYTGMWWNPQESGWGLSLHQSAADSMLGTLFVYGASRDPQWFTLQDGRWESSTRWSAQVYRTNGPAFTAPVFDPAAVSARVVGAATLEFGTGPADEEGSAIFTYSVDGVTISKVLSRAL